MIEGFAYMGMKKFVGTDEAVCFGKLRALDIMTTRAG